MTRHRLTSEADLEAHYGQKNPRSLVKELDHISDDYARFI